MSRLIIENIIDRARSVLRIEGDRAMIRAALLDITMEVALSMATKTNALVQQSYAGSAAKLRVIRKLRADWRAIIKGVKSVYADHPISERHMYVTLLAYFPSLADTKAFADCVLSSNEHFQLHRCERAAARRTVHSILSRHN